MLATAAADAHINQPWPDKVHACVVVQLSTMLVGIEKGRGVVHARMGWCWRQRQQQLHKGTNH